MKCYNEREMKNICINWRTYWGNFTMNIENIKTNFVTIRVNLNENFKDEWES